MATALAVDLPCRRCRLKPQTSNFKLLHYRPCRSASRRGHTKLTPPISLCKTAF
jgi:hypothetical protein